MSGQMHNPLAYCIFACAHAQKTGKVSALSCKNVAFPNSLKWPLAAYPPLLTFCYPWPRKKIFQSEERMCRLFLILKGWLWNHFIWWSGKARGSFCKWCFFLLLTAVQYDSSEIRGYQLPSRVVQRLETKESWFGVEMPLVWSKGWVVAAISNLLEVCRQRWDGGGRTSSFT